MSFYQLLHVWRKLRLAIFRNGLPQFFIKLNYFIEIRAKYSYFYLSSTNHFFCSQLFLQKMNFQNSELKQFENIGLIAKQLVDGFIAGLHKSPYHGFSVEFSEHKQYNYGESTRHVDWKVYARTDRLYTKQYQEETNLRCQILIDNSASMYYPKNGFRKIDFANYAAAALANLLIRQRDSVGLTIFSEIIEFESIAQGTRSHYINLLENLPDNHRENKSTQTHQILDEIAERINKRSLVILFSDMFQSDNDELLLSSLQHLKHQKHEVIVFHITDIKTELKFLFDNRPIKFIDLESKESIRANPADIRTEYQRKMLAYYEELRVKSGMMKIDFVSVDVVDSFDKVLSLYLIKRRKIRV